MTTCSLRSASVWITRSQSESGAVVHGVNHFDVTKVNKQIFALHGPIQFYRPLHSAANRQPVFVLLPEDAPQ